MTTSRRSRWVLWGSKKHQSASLRSCSTPQDRLSSVTHPRFITSTPKALQSSAKAFWSCWILDDVESMSEANGLVSSIRKELRKSDEVITKRRDQEAAEHGWSILRNREKRNFSLGLMTIFFGFLPPRYYSLIASSTFSCSRSTSFSARTFSLVLLLMFPARDTSAHQWDHGSLVLISANIVHADCTSHGNMRINEMNRRPDSTIPSTHGSQQHREDMSTMVIWLWRFVHSGTFMMMSIATCSWQLVDWHFIHGN